MAGTSGCITADMWGVAMSGDLRGGDIVGFVPADPGAGRPLDHLVLGYMHFGSSISLTPMSNDKPYYLAVPVEPDGSPLTPFAYPGCAPTLAALIRGVPEDWLATVAQHRIFAADFAVGRRLRDSPGFIPIGDVRCPISEPPGSFGSTRTTVFAYWPRASDPVGAATSSTLDAPFPVDAHVFFLPGTIARPAGDRLANVGLAALFTPVSLVEDVIVPPIFLYLLATGQLFTRVQEPRLEATSQPTTAPVSKP